MKTKISFFTLLTVLWLLPGCDDLLTISFDATFVSEMQIDVVEETKTTEYFFSATEVLDIEDDEDVKKNIDKLKSLDITRVDCTFINMDPGLVIHTFTVSVVEAGFHITLTNLQENTTVSLPVNNTMLTSLSNFLLSNKKATIQVNGSSSMAPVSFGVKLSFVSKLTAGI